MPLITTPPGDLQYFGRNINTFAQFTGYNAALAAAVAKSIANGNQPIQLGLVLFMINNANGSNKPPTAQPQIDLAGSGVPLYIIDLASAAAATYFIALSNSIGASRSQNHAYSFARWVQTIAAP